MKQHLTRLLCLWLTALLFLAAAGQDVQLVRAADEPPQELLDSDWYWLSDVQGALAGNSAAGAGDVNGDGYADVIVGAPLYSTEVYRSGAAFVFHGTDIGLEMNPRWIAMGEEKGSGFGNSVAAAGDVNCDGYADVIVGAPNYGQEHGKAYVYFGSKDGLSKAPDWTYTNEKRDSGLGWSVASAGDVNGDSQDGHACDDVIVGALYYSEGQDLEGAAFVFYGSPDGLSLTPDWIGQGNQEGARYGYSVSGVGDIDQDGFDDVLVGAPFYDDVGLRQGAIFLYYGSDAGLSPTAGWEDKGDQAEARLGWSVAGAGNVNGDDFPDLVAGAPGWVNEMGTVGAVYVYHGSWSSPSLVPDWSHTGEAPGIGYGEAVGGAGEVNGDGYDDLIVGAHNYSSNRIEKNGAIYVHHGGPNGLSEYPGWRAEGNKSDTGFGASVGAAGDVTLDGYGDLIVGAPEYKLADENNRGGAFLYYGFWQEVIDGVIVPRNLNFYLPVMTR